MADITQIKIGTEVFDIKDFRIDDIYAQLNKKANDFSIEIYNGTSGNPKPVRFATFNYSTCNSENGIAAKISMVSGHGNGTSYAFLQDAIIRVDHTGKVEVDNFKYYGTDTGTYDGIDRQYGDIFWINDTTNKTVDFYCLMGQYARVYQTPWKRITYSSKGTVTQYTQAHIYSNGEKIWANNSNIATIGETINKSSALPISGGILTGELGIKQGGVGIQLGTSGNICATDTHKGGITTRTILGAGIHWATDAEVEDEMTVGHPYFHLALRGSKKRPTYCQDSNKANNTELALLEDIPSSTATASKNGLMSSSDKEKLDNISEDADSVSFTPILKTGTKIGTITINGSDTDLYSETNTDTHHVTGILAGGSSNNTNKAETNPYIKVTDNGVYRSQIQLKGSGATTIKSDANGVITINSTDNNTHYESKNVVGSPTDASNTTAALTNGNVYLNNVENGVVTSSHNIKGTGKTTVTADVNGNIIINSTDSDTHYTTGITAGASGTTTNSATSNPYVKIKDDSTHRSEIQLKGDGATSVKSNNSGIITISSTDNNTTYTITSGDSNGQIKITPSSGAAYNVSVNGLGSAAYTDSETYLAKSGGTMTGSLKLSGGDGVNAGKIILDPGNASQITDNGTATIFGFITNGTQDLTVGSTTAYNLKLRGKEAKPTYNGNSLALYTDVPTKYAGSNSTGGPATSANKVNSSLTIGSKTFNGSTAVEITAEDLGLNQAMRFIGISSTKIEDGKTTNPIVINNVSVTAISGDVVLYGGYEYVWANGAWEQLGQEGSFSLKTHKHTINKYTPAGTVSAPTITVTPITATVNSITGVGELPSLGHENVSASKITNWSAGTLPSASLSAGSGSASLTGSVSTSGPNRTVTLTFNHTHTNPSLTFNAGTAPTLTYSSVTASKINSWSAGSLPTKGSNTNVVTGIQKVESTQPVFTGTEATLTMNKADS